MANRNTVPTSFTLEKRHLPLIRQKQRRLAQRGYTHCSRSEVVRLALECLDAETAPIPADAADRPHQRPPKTRRKKISPRA